MTYCSMFRPNQFLSEWVRYAAKREEVTEIPSKYLVPRIEGDEVLCPISIDVDTLIRTLAAVHQAFDRKEAELLAVDSYKEMMAFRFEEDAIGVPLSDSLLLQILAQVWLDARNNGVIVQKYLAIGFTVDRMVVGYKTKALCDWYSQTLVERGFTPFPL